MSGRLAIPPLDGNDYIFYPHPPDKKIPNPTLLIVWYKNMLDQGMAENIIFNTRTSTSRP